MDITYEYAWRKDCSPLLDDLINVAESKSQFTRFLNARRKDIEKGNLDTIVVLSEGKPVGFLIYGFKENIGKIKFIHVLDVPEKQEIAVTLLERAIELLKQRKDLADISGELYYIAGPIDILADHLLDAGAYVYTRVGMARDKKGAPPKPVLPEGYSVRQWSKEDIPLLAEVFYKAFKDSIDLVFWADLEYPETALTFISKIVNSVEISKIPLTNLFAMHNGNICGATLCGIPEKGKGGIMLGVRKEHRGKGLGRFLLTQALTGYHDAGIETVGLEVTLQNEVAYPFFKRYGFEDVYRLIGYAFSPGSKIEF
ncbi:MAG: GNAT family N-acetyltransferase [Candidatus Methanofastidiosia archaeon]|jgi:ribosomal protein S18 acetylase RimI-like enzyme